MPMARSFPESSVDVVRGLASEAAREARALQTKANQASQTHHLWQELASYLAKGWPLHVVSLVDTERARLDSMRAEDGPVVAHLEGLYRVARGQIEEILRRYPALLEQACSNANLPLDRSSRHPRYTFVNGFFQLDIDDRRGIARLSDYEGRLGDEFPADIGAVVEAVETERRRVFGRAFDPSKFLRKLHHQYLAVLKSESEHDGATVPLRSITRRLGKNEKGFRTDEFLVDLSRLVETGPLEIEGYRLDLEHTKDTHQGMLLHGAAARGYIGFVAFRRVSHG